MASRHFGLVAKLHMVAAVCVATASCIANKPHQIDLFVEDPGLTGGSCGGSYREEDNYDIGIVEFSERGNVFRRDCMEHVLDSVEKVTKDGNTAVVVFVHGWRHNAESISPKRDQNLHCFKELLKSFSRKMGVHYSQDVTSEICFKNNFPRLDKGVTSPPLQVDDRKWRGVLHEKQRVIGVYIGWRGLPFRGGVTEIASYWDRKAVAEEIGRGGVSELLLRLEDITWRSQKGRIYGTPEYQNSIDANNGNVFLTIGHSFGGAIVLAALHDVFVERVVSAQTLDPERCGSGQWKRANPCVITRPFGHGVVLLNPAIEATQISQLKELSASRRFSEKQSRLLHVVSTSADRATNTWFPLGQRLGIGLSSRQTKLLRKRPSGDWIQVDELDLDTTTVGNYAPYRTGFLKRSRESTKDAPRWCYHNCVPRDRSSESLIHDCVYGDAESKLHYAVRPYNPLALVYTDDSFMDGHNDVFNLKVRAYLSAIVAESLRRRGELSRGFNECATDFSFQSCFEYFLELEAHYLVRDGRDPTALGRYSSREICALENAES